MSLMIYCNPGNGWAACWAQRANCTPEIIESYFSGVLLDDDEKSFKAFIGAMKKFEREVGKLVEYCEDCGHRIMMDELEKTADK